MSQPFIETVVNGFSLLNLLNKVVPIFYWGENE